MANTTLNKLSNKTTSFAKTQPKGVVSANREPIDLILEVLAGQLPYDIYGHLFFITQVGSVNSDGLPIPQYNTDGTLNKEYSSPVMNGDGYVFRIDFDKIGSASIKGKLFKTPCYYADEATKYGGPLAQHPTYKHWGFHNLGIARLSYQLGIRNQLNTSIMPAQFKGDQSNRFFVSYDVGRPYEFDPQSLELKSPLGTHQEWTVGTPGFVNFPFPIIQTTAHPVYDPKTQEFFTVNFTKSPKTMLSSAKFLTLGTRFLKLAEKKLEKIITKINPQNREESLRRINRFFHEVEEEVAPKKWWKKLGFTTKKLRKKVHKLIKKVTNANDEVYLMLWKGAQQIHKWKLIDQDQHSLVIFQSMHQIALTQDYIVLIDNSFKFSLDILINDPFPHNPTISAFIRNILSKPMLPQVEAYLIKREDLNPNEDFVKVRKLKTPIPLECVHFSSDYANEQDQITLYMAHNSAACMAEWMRPYDTLAIDPQQSVDSNLLGLFSVGGMDIGRIGKVVIDAQKGEIVKEKTAFLAQTGNLKNLKEIGPHTWELGLYTYRDIISADVAVEHIKDMYFVCYGSDPRMLTNFIFKLYKNYPNRKIHTDDILKYTKEGIPPIITRFNTKNMRLEDHFQFELDYNLRSIQFCPRFRSNSQDPTIPLSRDGYIVCTLINPSGEVNHYRREIWIFDANNLAQGPVCILGHNDLDYTFPLHSVWVDNIEPNDTNYQVDTREDYNEVIQRIKNPKKRQNIQAFFESYVYPHFE